MSKLIIVKMIIFYSNVYGVNPQIALSVAKIESGLNPMAISKTHDYGLFQLNEASFKQYSIKQLLNPNINIIEGIKYLAKMQKECKYRNNLDWLTCWNMGKTYVAKNIKYPSKHRYVKKIIIAMGEF